MPSTLVVAAEFLLQSLFGLYILAFMLRFLFQLVRADFYNPLSNFLVKVTNPLLAPVRRLIPGLFGIDVASIVVMLLLQVVEIYIIGEYMFIGRYIHLDGFLTGQVVPFLPTMVLAISALIKIALYVFIVSLFIQAIISWINPGSYTPLTGLLYSLNEPLLRPVRRRIPPVGGMDLSPLAVIIVLQLLQIIIHPSMHQLAYSLYR